MSYNLHQNYLNLLMTLLTTLIAFLIHQKKIQHKSKKEIEEENVIFLIISLIAITFFITSSKCSICKFCILLMVGLTMFVMEIIDIEIAV